MKRLHAVPHVFKRLLLNQIAKPEPSRIVEMVREEIRTPGIERQAQREMIFGDSMAELRRIQGPFTPRRLNDICYEG
jgi:hypothetical protein